MNIRPIHNETIYVETLAEVERLFDSEPGTPEGDRLEILVTLLEAYEKKHYPILPPDPVDAIEYWMESRGLSRRDLEPYIGARGRVAEVLNRRRPLSVEMIRRLNTGLGLPAEILIRPYALQRAA
jgi:HTH-type transcriptional regulator / antitoxin HigA